MKAFFIMKYSNQSRKKTNKNAFVYAGNNKLRNFEQYIKYFALMVETFFTLLLCLQWRWNFVLSIFVICLKTNNFLFWWESNLLQKITNKARRKYWKVIIFKLTKISTELSWYHTHTIHKAAMLISEWSQGIINPCLCSFLSQWRCLIFLFTLLLGPHIELTIVNIIRSLAA